MLADGADIALFVQSGLDPCCRGFDLAGDLGYDSGLGLYDEWGAVGADGGWEQVRICTYIYSLPSVRLGSRVELPTAQKAARRKLWVGGDAQVLEIGTGLTRFVTHGPAPRTHLERLLFDSESLLQ